jgi:hypothetical protein
MIVGTLSVAVLVGEAVACSGVGIGERSVQPTDEPMMLRINRQNILIFIGHPP